MAIVLSLLTAWLVNRGPKTAARAFGPAFFLRGDSGARLGIAGMAVYAPGLNALVGNFTWTAAGTLYQKGHGARAEVALGQGFSYRVRPDWVLDFAVRERGLAAGPREVRVLAGFTVNLGRLCGSC